jgi:Zn-dependent peptidase ImmA (M78 family)/DNA-binding XRE family transcriptional regulator
VAAARRAAGFTQEHLGQRIGVHRSAMARIENGQRQLDALELAGLAEALGRSVAWFVTAPPTLIASHRRATADDRSLVVLEDELEGVARDTELLLEIDELAPPEHPTPAVESLDDAISAARVARETIGHGEGPLHDLGRALEGLGLLVFSLDVGSGVGDGAYVRVGDVGVAVLNGEVAAGRRRFNAAHELGHHLIGDEYSADFAVGQSHEDRERLLDAFAIHFLAPNSSVHRRWEELTADEGIRSTLIRIAAEYRLSWSAACSHACNLGLIDAGRRAVLQERRPTTVDYLELGIGFEEELVPPWLPQNFAQAVVRAYRKNKIGADRAVELLRETISADDLPAPHELPMEALAGDFGRA